MIRTQQSAKSFAGYDWAFAGTGFGWLDRKWNDVADLLMGPFKLMMLEALDGSVLERRLAEEDLSVKTFILDGADRSFHEGLRFGLRAGTLCISIPML